VLWVRPVVVVGDEVVAGGAAVVSAVPSTASWALPPSWVGAAVSSPRGETVRRLYKRLVVDKPEPPDPSVPVLVSDGLVVWPDGRYIATSEAAIVTDDEAGG
jgi:hypothetical protein